MESARARWGVGWQQLSESQQYAAVCEAIVGVLVTQSEEIASPDLRRMIAVADRALEIWGRGRDGEAGS